MKRTVLALVFVLLAGGIAHAAGGDPLPAPTKKKKDAPQTSPELTYNEGLVLVQKGEWVEAEEKFRHAIKLNPRLPEAWNELGHTLKMQRKFDEAVAAYKEALRLRPKYPQALEYLGEAYVQMGKIDEAKAVLAQLQPLDEGHAEVLARVIQTGRDPGW